MLKAIFTDFYGTVVHEDGEVIRKVSQEICATGKVNDISEVGSYWWNEFQTHLTVHTVIALRLKENWNISH